MSVAAEAHGGHAHGAHPPVAHASSRANPVQLGIYLFIASEAMLFGSFFAAYFFARVSAHPETWPPEPYHLPVYLALLNTIILVTSSFTVHWALHGVKTNHRPALLGGLGLTIGLGLTFLLIQIMEFLRVGFSPRDLAFGSTFYGLTGLHGLHVFVGLVLLTIALWRSLRGHFTPQHHLGVEVPGIYWHFVDVMWIIVYVTVYVI